jgi:hypothetical protein
MWMVSGYAVHKNKLKVHYRPFSSSNLIRLSLEPTSFPLSTAEKYLRALQWSFENYCVWLVRSIILHVARVTSPKLISLADGEYVAWSDRDAGSRLLVLIHGLLRAALPCHLGWLLRVHEHLGGPRCAELTGPGKLSTQLLFLSWLGFAEVGRARANFDGN